MKIYFLEICNININRTRNFVSLIKNCLLHVVFCFIIKGVSGSCHRKWNSILVTFNFWIVLNCWSLCLTYFSHKNICLHYHFNDFSGVKRKNSSRVCLFNWILDTKLIQSIIVEYIGDWRDWKKEIRHSIRTAFSYPAL